MHGKYITSGEVYHLFTLDFGFRISAEANRRGLQNEYIAQISQIREENLLE